KARHLSYTRQRGLPGRVDHVDNQDRIVTVTLFGGIDDELLGEIAKDDITGIAVARESLMTYDPVNDRRKGPVLEILTIDQEPGSSGIQVRIQPDLLLEGYRPGRIVRIYPSAWPVIALPREEEYFGR
ncbi:MAG: hypothetical protein KDA85_12165, partial [Planctomycetaceae bacterium]|nr:hypothetical protein [Planctomycetaceae bacterium]